MRHLIPSLCLALFLAETACSAPHATKRNDSDVRQKNAATRQRAESAYNELDNFGTATANVAKTANAQANSTGKKIVANAEAASETYADPEAIQDIAQPIIMVSPNLTMKDGAPDLSSESPYSRTTSEAINSYLTSIIGNITRNNLT